MWFGLFDVFVSLVAQLQDFVKANSTSLDGSVETKLVVGMLSDITKIVTDKVNQEFQYQGKIKTRLIEMIQTIIPGYPVLGVAIEGLRLHFKGKSTFALIHP